MLIKISRNRNIAARTSGASRKRSSRDAGPARCAAMLEYQFTKCWLTSCSSLDLNDAKMNSVEQCKTFSRIVGAIALPLSNRFSSQSGDGVDWNAREDITIISSNYKVKHKVLRTGGLDSIIESNMMQLNGQDYTRMLVPASTPQCYIRLAHSPRRHAIKGNLLWLQSLTSSDGSFIDTAHRDSIRGSHSSISKSREIWYGSRASTCTSPLHARYRGWGNHFQKCRLASPGDW